MKNKLKLLTEEQMTEKQVKQFKDKLFNDDKPVKFKYIKKNGDKRTAKGTLNIKLIPDGQKFSEKKIAKRARPKDIIVYFDLEKNQFRCFSSNRFIKYL